MKRREGALGEPPMTALQHIAATDTRAAIAAWEILGWTVVAIAVDETLSEHAALELRLHPGVPR